MTIFDFTNIIGVAAQKNPNLRFAVFSDCVIISCNQELVYDFILTLQLIHSHWFADHIFVRGGIDIGEINWVDYPVIDKGFDHLINFSYARVYGNALVGAYEIERNSGPGPICYVSEEASKLLRQANENYIIDGITDMLIWADKRLIDGLHRTFEFLLDRNNFNENAKRHIIAAYKYFSNLKNSGKFLAPLYDYTELDLHEAE